MSKIRGSHFLVAVANRVMIKSLEEKIDTIVKTVQPGFTYNELIDVIHNDEEIPDSYVDNLIKFGLEFPELEHDSNVDPK
jgi:hypothetical protein